MSFPLYGEQLTFIQPNGTRFEARGWGDQNSARFETLDGYEIVLDPATHYYHYATTTSERDELRPMKARVGIDAPQQMALSRGSQAALDATSIVRAHSSGLPKQRWRERLTQRQHEERLHTLSGGITPAPPSRRTVGDYLGLCLPIDFADEPRTIQQEVIDAFCNMPGYNRDGNNGSVYDYFFDNSAGYLRYKTLVAPYYRAIHPKTYYLDESIGNGVRARELIKEALAHHLQQGFDFSALTVDDQQYVFATNVFYAGRVDNNWSKGLWPHASRLATPFPLSPGVSAVDYQISAIGSKLTLGTYCHENGHMLCDFPDLYRYSNSMRGVGRYCLMCLGGNADPLNPVNVGGYLKYRAGWATDIVLDDGMHATAAPTDNKVFVHLNAKSGEYFIIENRQKQGRDTALPASGLAVWHIDELGSNSDPATAPSGHRRQECLLVQADGRSELDDGANDGEPGDLFPPGNAPIFLDAAAPSSHWWNGSPSGLQVTSIQADNDKISFSVQILF